MHMNHAEIIHIEVKYLFMNTAQKNNYNLVSPLSNAYMLKDHYTILFDNELDNHNLLK